MRDRLRNIKKGEQIIYHTGCLASDREFSKHINDIAHEAWMLCVHKTVTLVQKKISAYQYEYIAIGTSGR